MAGDGDRDGDDEDGRHAVNGIVADEVPDRRIELRDDEPGREIQDERIVDRANDDQSDERRQKGAQPEIADKDNVQ